MVVVRLHSYGIDVPDTQCFSYKCSSHHFIQNFIFYSKFYLHYIFVRLLNFLLS